MGEGRDKGRRFLSAFPIRAHPRESAAKFGFDFLRDSVVEASVYAVAADSCRLRLAFAGFVDIADGRLIDQ
jgi:hypothetical protein